MAMLDCDMRFILDGDSRSPIPTPALVDLLEEIDHATLFLPNEPIARVHIDWVKEIARQYARALYSITTILNGHLAPSRKRIQVQLYDSAAFTAFCLAPHVDKDGIETFPVLISLGMFSRVLGLAHRFAIATVFGGSGWSTEREELEEWDYDRDPIGCLMLREGDYFDKLTRQLAIDAMMLAFLHEVAHELHGHLDYACAGSEEERALECDADYGAAEYFCRWLQQFSQISGTDIPEPRTERYWRLISDIDIPVSQGECLWRLSRAAFLLTALIRAESRQNEKYHLPETRLSDMLSGAMSELGLHASTEASTNANKVFGRATINIRIDFLGAGLSRFVIGRMRKLTRTKTFMRTFRVQ